MSLGQFLLEPGDSRPRPRRRRGFGLVEMAVAGVLLATMVLITVQLVDWSAADRPAIARREMATRLVSAVLERTLARPWDKITTEQLAPLAAAFPTREALGAATLRVEVTPAPPVDGRGQKKVVVEVVWPVKLGNPGAPVRLVTWTTEPKRTEP